MSALISVQLDAVQALAADLASLATALAEEVPLCSSTARSVATALAGREGLLAWSAASGWAGLVDAMAGRTGAISTVLSSAVEAYRAADTQLSQRIGAGPVGVTAIAR
jgi:hypothetical protein